MKITRRGLMLVLSSPSGAGKTSISRRLLELDDELTMSISATTRSMRPGEVDGEDYYFLTPERFSEMRSEGAFLEHATVFDNSYGTPRTPVEDSLELGRDVLFDVDWQGTQQLAANARDDLVSIFVLPPSLKELEKRLRGRAQDSEDVVQKRMSRASSEMSHYAEYDYVIVNRDLDQSVEQVRAVLDAERLRRQRQVGLTEFVRGMGGGN